MCSHPPDGERQLGAPASLESSTVSRRSSTVVVAVAVAALLGAAAGAVTAHSARSAGLIAFARSCSIYVINAAGGGQQRLTRPGNGCAGTPSWSPDGRRLAFVRRYDDPTGLDREFPGEIHVMNADGSGARRITRRVLDVGVPTWSPRGTAIAFDQREGGAGIVNADGTNQRVLAPTLSFPAGPSWSPDGHRIAVASGTLWTGSIGTVTPNGRAVRRVTIVRKGEYLAPAWSPDGRTIVFTRLVCAYPKGFCGAEVRAVASAGGADRPLLRIPDSAANPKSYWSPNGKRILVEGGLPGLWIMRADGTQRRALTRNSDAEPTWSPDGQRIAFTRLDSNYGGDKDTIYIIRADGTQPRKIALGGSPAWQPTD